MIFDTLILSIREIRRHVMRSMLTILGIVIGVASVITMVTLGNGATQQVTSQIQSMGTNLLMVNPGKMLGPGQSSERVPFKLADVEAISNSISSVMAAAPVSSQSLTAIYGNENWSTSVNGTDNRYFKIRNWALESGRQFNDNELRAGSAVCVIGATIQKKLFKDEDPIGKRIRLGKTSFQVIGLLESKGQSSMGSDQDDLVILPFKTFSRRVSGNNNVSIIQVSVEDGASTDKVKADIVSMLRVRRHLSDSEDDNFSVMDMKELVSMLTGTTKILTALLSAIAAVSLLVGGIGIMNIMLVSVTERTREIGIRLAIGALKREVMMQFLVESIVLSSSGGIIGITFGLGACYAAKGVLQVPFIFNTSIVITSFLFSAMVGVVFGYFPALKAASLNPIEALRHE